MEAYFKPTRNVVYERYVFGKCDQGSDESIDQYVTRLRHLSNSCDFGELTDEFLRDRIVLGTSSIAAREKLFREKKLTLDDAIDICRTSELAAKQLKEIVKPDEIQYARKASNTKKTTAHNKHHASRKRNTRKCKYCGESHTFGIEFCKAYGKECGKCGILSHFAKVCKSDKSNYLENSDSDSEHSVL